MTGSILNDYAFKTLESWTHRSAKELLGYWLEEGRELYPINKKVKHVWLEHVIGITKNGEYFIPHQEKQGDSQVVVKELLKNGSKPSVVLDLFVETTTGEKYGIEIVKSNICSDAKIQKLLAIYEKLDIRVFEIEADWILDHTKEDLLTDNPYNRDDIPIFWVTPPLQKEKFWMASVNLEDTHFLLEYALAIVADIRLDMLEEGVLILKNTNDIDHFFSRFNKDMLEKHILPEVNKMIGFAKIEILEDQEDCHKTIKYKLTQLAYEY